MPNRPSMAQRAQALIDAEAVHRDPEYPSIFWVDAHPGERSPYRVQLDPVQTCTCEHGMHNPTARCYHVLAVQMAVGNRKRG